MVVGVGKASHRKQISKMKTDSQDPKRGRPATDTEAANGWIQLRVTMARKNAYVRAAKPKKLTAWVFQQLDKASGYEPTEQD